KRGEAHARSTAPAKRQTGRNRRPTWMFGEKFFGLLRSFRVEQRAGYINEPPARAYERSGDFEQVALERYETVKPGLVKPPACFRMTAPGAGAGAWSVHEHGVRPALPGGERLGLTARIEQDGLSDKRAGSLGTRAELRKP